MGFKVDKNADLFPEGLFMFEVVACDVKHSQASGDPYFKVTLRDVYTRRTLFENWMMAGNGQGMTVPKLRALELDLDKDVEAGDLIGRRLIARIKHKDSEKYGTQAQIGKSWPESKPPQEWLAEHPEPGSPDLFDGKDDPASSKAGDTTDDGSPF